MEPGPDTVHTVRSHVFACRRSQNLQAKVLKWQLMCKTMDWKAPASLNNQQATALDRPMIQRQSQKSTGSIYLEALIHLLL